MRETDRDPNAARKGEGMPHQYDGEPNLSISPLSLAAEIARGHSVPRAFLHCCIKKYVSLSGRVIDFGSGKNPKYLRYLDLKYVQYSRADGNPSFAPDILLDLEEPFPIEDESYDAAILLNVLEHLYDPRSALAEVRRILKPNGTLYLMVPYMIKIHGSPCDYFRYTHFALARLLKDAGFSQLSIYTDGGLLKYLSELLNWSSRFGIGYAFFPIYYGLCLLDSLIGKLTKSKYSLSLPVGYFVVARL
jgi:SAM-dependent methyltransferase